jgi:hypothetical protein
MERGRCVHSTHLLAPWLVEIQRHSNAVAISVSCKEEECICLERLYLNQILNLTPLSDDCTGSDCHGS